MQRAVIKIVPPRDTKTCERRCHQRPFTIELVDPDALHEYTVEYLVLWGSHLAQEIENSIRLTSDGSMRGDCSLALTNAAFWPDGCVGLAGFTGAANYSSLLLLSSLTTYWGKEKSEKKKLKRSHSTVPRAQFVPCGNRHSAFENKFNTGNIYLHNIYIYIFI